MLFGGRDVPSPRTLLCRRGLGVACAVTLKLDEILWPETGGECFLQSPVPPRHEFCEDGRRQKRVDMVLAMQKQYRDAGFEAPEFVAEMATDAKLSMTKRPWERECFRARRWLRECMCRTEEE